MHRGLKRQLRQVGIEDEDILARALAECQQLDATSLSPDLALLVQGLPALLKRVELTYEQYDRDLILRTRSLTISSDEMSLLNGKLRSELESRERAIASLQSTADNLLGRASHAPDQTSSLEDLSMLLADVVRQREDSRRERDNQQFALDQHTIVSVTTASGAIRYANDKFCEISGYTLPELMGQDHNLLRSGVHNDAFYDKLWRTIQAGQVWKGEICSRSKRGQLFWTATTIVPCLDAQGVPVEFIAVRTDITQRKQTEQNLVKTASRLALAAGAADIGVWESDLKTGRFELDAQMLQIFRIPQQITSTGFGRLVRRIVHAQRRVVVGVFMEAVRNGTSLQTEFDIILPDGSLRTLRCAATLTWNQQGKAERLIGVIFDITQLKQAELSMREAKEAAERANRAKSEFLANMSHEIRTPMNAVLGLSHLLLQTSMNTQQVGYVTKLRQSGQHLLGVIDDILDFSKVEAGQMALEQIELDLSQVLDNVVNLIGDKAKEKGLALHLQVAPDVPLHVVGDPLRIGQILVNYANNAVKFTASGHINIRVEVLQAHAHEAMLKFSVQDTGIGVREEELSRLFQSFQQADSSTTRKFGGTGLGLAICKRLAALMEGEVGVHSVIGQGATFWFTARLRIPELAVGAGVKSVAVLSAARLQGARVLLVEDNLINQEVASGLLRHAGVAVTVANHGQQALEMLAQDTFDLVLMDMQMPVMDGLSATRAIRARPEWQQLPVVAMTANALPADRQACEDCGMNDFVAKPIEPDMLMRALLRWIPERPQPGAHKPVVLVVHSDPERLSQMHGILKANYKVKVANSAQRALAIQHADAAPDLVVLPMDWPGLDGWALSAQLPDCPLLMLAEQPHQIEQTLPLHKRVLSTQASASQILQEIQTLLACSA